MDIEFDPEKDAANLAKHGISLARAIDLDPLAFVEGDRFAEPRFRLYGMIDGEAFCVAGTKVGDLGVATSCGSSVCAGRTPRRYAAMSNDPVFDADNPEWTKEDFARAKRGDAIPAPIRAAFGKRGRPAGSAKTQVTLRIDTDVLERFRAAGPGWQTRINEVLRRAV